MKNLDNYDKKIARLNSRNRKKISRYQKEHIKSTADIKRTCAEKFGKTLEKIKENCKNPDKDGDILEKYCSDYLFMYNEIIGRFKGLAKDSQLSVLNKAYADGAKNIFYKYLLECVRAHRKNPSGLQDNFDGLRILDPKYKADYKRLRRNFLYMTEKSAEFSTKFGTSLHSLAEKKFFSEFVSVSICELPEDMTYAEFKNFAVLCIRKHKEEEKTRKKFLPFLPLVNMGGAAGKAAAVAPLPIVPIVPDIIRKLTKKKPPEPPLLGEDVPPKILVPKKVSAAAIPVILAIGVTSGLVAALQGGNPGGGGLPSPSVPWESAAQAVTLQEQEPKEQKEQEPSEPSEQKPKPTEQQPSEPKEPKESKAQEPKPTEPQPSESKPTEPQPSEPNEQKQSTQAKKSEQPPQEPSEPTKNKPDEQPPTDPKPSELNEPNEQNPEQNPAQTPKLQQPTKTKQIIAKLFPRSGARDKYGNIKANPKTSEQTE